MWICLRAKAGHRIFSIEGQEQQVDVFQHAILCWADFGRTCQ